jgi:hypothetical protein
MQLIRLAQRLIGSAAYRIRKRQFDFAARSIYRTRPLICDPDSTFVIVSQSRHADVTMYLVAVKSFARFLRPKRFVIIDDGLTPGDRQILTSHIDQIQFVPLANIEVGSCPTRSCWERLISISRLCADNYVVQLDSDTITVSEPSEVLNCIRANRTFTMGTQLGRSIVTVAEASSFASGVDSDQVQIIAERALAGLPDAESRRYVRGCAAFAGFGRGAISVDDVERFSALMESRIGSRLWRSWGSEQFTSNYLVANTADPLVLPFERYPYWAPQRNLFGARLIHFIGDHRFYGGEYLRQAQAIVGVSTS